MNRTIMLKRVCALLGLPLFMLAEMQNRQIYLSKDFSKITNIIDAISKLDTNEHSPLQALKKHIDQGILIGNYDEILETFKYAHDLLNKQEDNQATRNVAQMLNFVIHQITDGALDVNDDKTMKAYHYPLLTLSKRLLVKGKSTFNSDVIVDKKLRVHKKARFYHNAYFKDNVKIDGTLSVNDAVIGNATFENCVNNLCVNDLSVVDLIVSGSSIGITGATGPTGPTGATGDTGPTGATGSFNGTIADNQFTITDATDTTKQLLFDVQGSPLTKTTMITNPTLNRNLITPDIDGTILVSQTGTNEVFIGGPTGALHGSGSGIQYSTDVASRAQIRFNQYGNNTGVPGISTFKSRSAVIGGLAPVQPGDVIYRATAVGVTDNLSIPLSGLISLNVAQNGVPAGQGYIATDYELQLVSLNGPANGRRVVYKITSEGVQQFLETTSAGPHTTVPTGLVTLDGTGNITVSNNRIPANARILLTVQPGVAPTGTVYVSAINTNTSFTITSNAGASDSGVNVYYQIFIPLP